MAAVRQATILASVRTVWGSSATMNITILPKPASTTPTILDVQAHFNGSIAAALASNPLKRSNPLNPEPQIL